MKYAKPELVHAGSAFKVIQSTMKDPPGVQDSNIPTYTEGAYQSDE
jgi:hypothetical protein